MPASSVSEEENTQVSPIGLRVPQDWGERGRLTKPYIQLAVSRNNLSIKTIIIKQNKPDVSRA